MDKLHARIGKMTLDVIGIRVIPRYEITMLCHEQHVFSRRVLHCALIQAQRSALVHSSFVSGVQKIEGAVGVIRLFNPLQLAQKLRIEVLDLLHANEARFRQNFNGYETKLCYEARVIPDAQNSAANDVRRIIG